MTASEYKSLFDRVEEALNEVRPHLAVDGGNVELVEITEDLTAKVKWIGSCEFCSMSSMTMKAGVQETVKSRVPEIDHVVAINGINN